MTKPLRLYRVYVERWDVRSITLLAHCKRDAICRAQDHAHQHPDLADFKLLDPGGLDFYQAIEVCS